MKVVNLLVVSKNGEREQTSEGVWNSLSKSSQWTCKEYLDTASHGMIAHSTDIQMVKKASSRSDRNQDV